MELELYQILGLGALAIFCVAGVLAYYLPPIPLAEYRGKYRGCNAPMPDVKPPMASMNCRCEIVPIESLVDKLQLNSVYERFNTPMRRAIDNVLLIEANNIFVLVSYLDLCRRSGDDLMPEAILYRFSTKEFLRDYRRIAEPLPPKNEEVREHEVL